MKLRRKNINKTEEKRSANRRQRVYSYYAASSQQLNNIERQSASDAKQQTTRRKLKAILKNWVYVLFGAVLAVGVIYSLTLKQEASVNIQGTHYRKDSEYTKIVNATWGKNWFNYFKPTMDTNKFEAELKSAVPEASSIKVTVPVLGRRPEVKIITDKPLAIFAETDIEKYVLSERGRVLLPAGESSNGLENLPTIYNKSGIKLEEGKQFVTPDQAKAIDRLIFQSGANQPGSKVSFEIPLQPQEILLRDPSKGSFFSRYMLDSQNINQQYGAYLAVLKKIGENKPAQYVDARLADKVFVK